MLRFFGGDFRGFARKALCRFQDFQDTAGDTENCRITTVQQFNPTFMGEQFFQGIIKLRFDVSVFFCFRVFPEKKHFTLIFRGYN